MNDLISRQAAIAHAVPLNLFEREVMMVSVSELENLPSAQPEITLESAIDYLHSIGWMQEHDRILTESAQPEVKETGYAECANAMLKMWIDNVLTDGEYNRVMDRLNAHHNAGRRRAESEV